MKKEYLNRIALIKNTRGVYCLDTSVGCASGMAGEQGGCYGECYAAKSAKFYGYDFTKTVLRYFEGWWHLNEIIRQINSADLDFIRIGCSGDPSENWDHTFSILWQIGNCNKDIVIITRHWTLMTDAQMQSLSGQNICINTSVSALDRTEIRQRSLDQYERLKPFCKSVLRIISCDFNLENEEGKKLAEIQDSLFKNDATLDTVFRMGKDNPLVKSGVIKAKGEKFSGKKTLASRRNKMTYMGKCSTCHEMCGLNTNSAQTYPPRRGTIRQQKFKNV